MITDPKEIKSAIDYILSQDMYIRLTRESFDQSCPNPSMAIHVTARNVDEAVILSEIELACLEDKSITGSILFVKSVPLSIGKLQRIVALFSRIGDGNRGLCNKKPADGEIEIWFFVSAA